MRRFRFTIIALIVVACLMAYEYRIPQSIPTNPIASNSGCQEMLDNAVAQFKSLEQYKVKVTQSGKFEFSQDGRAYDGPASKMSYDGKQFFYTIGSAVNTITLWKPSENWVLSSWYYEWSFEFVDSYDLIGGRNVCAQEKIPLKKIHLLEGSLYYY